MLPNITTDEATLTRAGYIYSPTRSATTHDYSLTLPELLVAFGIPKTIFTRLNLARFCTVVDGVQLFCPVLVARSICFTLTKRNQTIQEYTAYVLAQSRRSTNPKKYGGARVSKRNGLMPTLHVINKLTANSPKARALFVRELEKIGVYLPPLEPQQNT